MSLRFYNTLTGSEKKRFIPLEPRRVRMYTCGPTVYNYAHIGNYRTFIFQDLLRRYLKYRGYRLLHVMNITDVDDKIIRDSKAAGLSLRDFTDKFTQAFLDDIDTSAHRPPGTCGPRDGSYPGNGRPDPASLEERGLAYRGAEPLLIYFRIASFPDYGKIARIDLAGILAGARVEVDEYEKGEVPATSRCGRRRSRVNHPGTPRSAPGVLAGTSSVPRCP